MSPYSKPAHRSEFFRPPPAIALFVVVLLVVGVVTGALAIRTMDHGEKDDLVGYLDVFLRGLARDPAAANAGEVWRLAALNHGRTALALWFLGLTIIGSPLIAVIVFVRGFILGFTVGFFVQELGYRGVMLATAAVLPSNLLAVPAFILLAVMALTFSTGLIRARPSRSMELARRVLAYSLLCLALTAGLLLAGVVEAYVSPVFIRLASRLWP